DRLTPQLRLVTKLYARVEGIHVHMQDVTPGVISRQGSPPTPDQRFRGYGIPTPQPCIRAPTPQDVLGAQAPQDVAGRGPAPGAGVIGTGPDQHSSATPSRTSRAEGPHRG